MSNNTIPIEEDDNESVMDTASLTIVMLVVGGILIIAIIIIAILCFQRWKTIKNKKFTTISPDIDTIEDSELQDMQINQFDLSNVETNLSIEEKTEL